MSQVEYRVTVHREDGSFWAEVDELPGCFAAGDTLEELWDSLADAIGAYLSDDDKQVTAELERADLETEHYEARLLVNA